MKDCKVGRWAAGSPAGPIKVLPSMKLLTFSADLEFSLHLKCFPAVNHMESGGILYVVYLIPRLKRQQFTENILTKFQHLKVFTLSRPIHVFYNQEDLTFDKLRTASQFDLEDSFLF